MVKLYEFKPMLGPAEEYPVGSIEWAERMSNRLQISAQSVSRSTAHSLLKNLKEIWKAAPRPWEVWPKGSPFGTPDDYCRAVTGHSWDSLLATVKELTGDSDLTPEKMMVDLARAQACERSQGTRTDTLGYNVTKLRGDRSSGGGNGSDYLLRRLARDYPRILDAYERGEFPSVRAAAKEAGIVKEQTPFEIARKQIPKLTEAERRQLRDLL